MNKIYINKEDFYSWLEHEAHKYTNRFYGKLSKEEFLDGIGNTIFDKAKQLNKINNQIKTIMRK